MDSAGLAITMEAGLPGWNPPAPYLVKCLSDMLETETRAVPLKPAFDPKAVPTPVRQPRRENTGRACNTTSGTQMEASVFKSQRWRYIRRWSQS
mmetsp:Transcript_122080/g.211850  ORF Transcript_122080/g.211850 Transcript_122080/m.211850 type:complete len:94 (-) Transcript_122080:355-636(-)